MPVAGFRHMCHSQSSESMGDSTDQARRWFRPTASSLLGAFDAPAAHPAGQPRDTGANPTDRQGHKLRPPRGGRPPLAGMWGGSVERWVRYLDPGES